MKYLVLLLTVVMASSGFARDPQLSPEVLSFFEREVRPVLVERCVSCHGPQRQSGHLQLDGRNFILTGGDSGPAVEPGDPKGSLLLSVVRHEHKKFKMPRGGERLPKAEVAALEKWIALGAPWPGSKRAQPAELAKDDRSHWSFQPVRRPEIGTTQVPLSASNAVDVFILARLEAAGIASNPEADRRSLIRRLTTDLTGLPPSPEEVEAFLFDFSPLAYERVVERLLASPRYGERWGRHWLDVVRFAQTNGYESDEEKPFAWRYRDYVIESLNADKPYDRFVKEQLAGDELDDATRESRIATGYYRIGPSDSSAVDRRLVRYEGLDDIVRTTSEAFLGLTIGCARCHDHMTDPLPQADYYRFLAFFHNVRSYEQPIFSPDDAVVSVAGDEKVLRAWYDEFKERRKKQTDRLAELDKPVSERLRAERLSRLPSDYQAAFHKPAKERNDREVELAAEAARRSRVYKEDIEDGRTDEECEQVGPVLEAIARLKREVEERGWFLSVSERGQQAPATFVFTRGNPAQPTTEVEAHFPAVLGSVEPRLPVPAPRKSSGRRRALAEWIADPSHPLTARVFVNRIWLHHFGRGLVGTPNDFGRGGDRPTHPLLLDWLASELVANDWRPKPLHRLIVTSSVYRRSAAAERPGAVERDPGNTLYWRQNLRRLDAEALRDSLLTVSGELNLQSGGPGVFLSLERQALQGSSSPGDGWGRSSEGQQARRSIYAFLKRKQPIPFFEGFDYVDNSQSLGMRGVTTVAPQALMLLNSRLVAKQSAALAARLTRECGEEVSAQVRRAYHLALQRSPGEEELASALTYLKQQQAVFARHRGQLIFEPEVPNSLSDSFLKKLAPHEVLSGPGGEWRYGKGHWRREYSNTMLDPDRGPYALWTGATIRHGTLSCTLRLYPATVLASVLFGATAGQGIFRGLEIRFRPNDQKVQIRRHEAGEVVVLASAAPGVRMDASFSFRVVLDERQVRVWIDSASVASDPVVQAPVVGVGAVHIGMRTWGSALGVKDLRLESGDEVWDVRPESSDESTAERQALASFASVLLNTNEFVYVD
jgi:hypothetical protein